MVDPFYSRPRWLRFLLILQAYRAIGYGVLKALRAARRISA